MSNSVVRFYNSIEDVAELSQAALIDLFVYYATVEAGETGVSAQGIRACFESCDLSVPARIAAHLSEGAKSKPPKFIKSNNGYRLERNFRDMLASHLGAEQVVVQASAELRKLENNFPEGPEKDFLKETITCFESGANRATIVMCWILTLDHLFHYILNNRIAEFNAALAQNTDKRVKITKVSVVDDFTEIPEGKFIEFCRSATIISNDVRKILDEKLGIRNTSAHPSAVKIHRSKVIEFVEDLVTNVILKYPI